MISVRRIAPLMLLHKWIRWTEIGRHHNVPSSLDNLAIEREGPCTVRSRNIRLPLRVTGGLPRIQQRQWHNTERNAVVQRSLLDIGENLGQLAALAAVSPGSRLNRRWPVLETG